MTPSQDTETIAAKAAAAAETFAATPPGDRAAAILAVADAIRGDADGLVALAAQETGLGEARLRGEIARTVLQLRLFADVVVAGDYLDVRIDEGDPAFVLGPRPDIRRYLVPVGPILNYAASNFPFAFSVAGGDTAAALAAGCPVIVKAHPGHPELSRRTAELVTAALAGAGMPDGAFQLVEGDDEGVALLTDPRVRAASFTGSQRAGRFLADIAAARPAPIPFYGELGSVNPVFVTRSGLAEEGEGFVPAFLASVSGSAGQLCTKPGFVFVPAGHALDGAISGAAEAIGEQRLLNGKITAGYDERRRAVLGSDGIRVLAEGGVRTDDEGEGWATPTIVATTLDAMNRNGERILDESFGPLSVLVEYDDEAQLPAAAEALFEGSLTATVHAADGESSPALRSLVRVLSERAGRVLFGGWPTGVAVTPAMQHGGPWPATTNDSSTSVGTASIGRFLRPVAYQGVPDALLPEPLRTSNPWGVPQRRSAAGESEHWGHALESRD
jgi:NADP-dependent aldehyde dehydrogenase